MLRRAGASAGLCSAKAAEARRSTAARPAFGEPLMLLHPPGTGPTSSGHSSQFREGHEVVLERPLLAIDRKTGRFAETQSVAAILTEFRILAHPALRHHPYILNIWICLGVRRCNG